MTAILNFDGIEYFDKPEEEFFDFLKQWVQDFGPNFEFGQFETRRVRPYADWDGKEKNKYTCYFDYEPNSGEQIIKIFGYHGKKVSGGSINMHVNQELSEV